MTTEKKKQRIKERGLFLINKKKITKKDQQEFQRLIKRWKSLESTEQN